jgi:hypothetical protein
MLQLSNFGSHMHRRLQNYYLLFPENDNFSIGWFCFPFIYPLLFFPMFYNVFTVYKVTLDNGTNNVFFIASSYNCTTLLMTSLSLPWIIASWFCIPAIITVLQWAYSGYIVGVGTWSATKTVVFNNCTINIFLNTVFTYLLCRVFKQ